jgi:hypothetical protein
MTTPAGGDSGTGVPFGTLPSPLDSIDDMRAAAKWMLAASGAVGVALISGGPLVAVGRVHGVGHAILAGLGLIVTLSGVGLAIWYTSRVLVPRLVTPGAFLASDALAGLRERIDQEPAEFMGAAATTVAGLFDRHRRLRRLVADLERQVAREKDTERLAGLRVSLRRAQANEELVGNHVRWVLALGHTWLVRADLDLSRRMTMAGGAIVVVGAVLYFIATVGNG